MIDIFKRAMQKVEDRYGRGISNRAFVARCVSGVIADQVNDLVTTSRERIKNLTGVAEVRSHDGPLLGFSPSMTSDKAQLQGFLQEKLYRDPYCVRVSQKGRRMVAALFEEFVREPAQLPSEHLARCAEIGRERAVCDYLAGMTDRYCAQEYERLFMPHGSDPGRLT